MYNTSKTIEIIPNENYGIASIEINNIIISNRPVIALYNIKQDYNIKITFGKLHTIFTQPSIYGSITPTTQVVEGSTQTFKFQPYKGYKIVDVIIDNERKGSIESYTFENVSTSHTISVMFEIEHKAVSGALKSSAVLHSDFLIYSSIVGSLPIVKFWLTSPLHIKYKESAYGLMASRLSLFTSSFRATDSKISPAKTLKLFPNLQFKEILPLLVSALSRISS